MPSIPVNFSDSALKEKRLFKPLNHDKIGVYVCGPTVYGRAHLGNLRSAVIFDLLHRFIKICAPQVTFVRNITDIDDKIIATAKARKISFAQLSKEMLALYHGDTQALACMMPTHEPHATQHINEMITLIELLIAKGHAYYRDGHVLFATRSYANYGNFCGRSLEEMIAGARVEVAPYKIDPQDFVLWKPSSQEEAEFSFPSPWGNGRPGWHIECSAMSMRYLGANFDIHGGGIDLSFPHHENEIAQSICANPGSHFAHYWLHNGLLTINGEKMSKSLGNIITLEDKTENPLFCLVLRYFFFTAHYRKPMDYNDKIMHDCWAAVQRIARAFINVAQYLGANLMTTLQGRTAVTENPTSIIDNYSGFAKFLRDSYGIDYKNEALHLKSSITPNFIELLADDLNSSALLGAMQSLARRLLHLENKEAHEIIKDFLDLFDACAVLGLNIWYYAEKIVNAPSYHNDNIAQSFESIPHSILAKAAARTQAKQNKNWAEADILRAEILAAGYKVRDLPTGGYVLEKDIGD